MINWLLGAQQGPDPGQRFQMGFEHAQQQQEHNALLGRQEVAQKQQQGHQMEVDHEAEIERRRDHIIMGAQLLQGVNDEAGYQRARQMAQQAGMDLSDIPPNFDPEYVRGVVDLGTRLHEASRPPQQPTAFQRDYDFIRQRDPALGETYFRNQAEGSPVVFDVNGDGAPDLVPRSYFNNGQQPAPGQPAAQGQPNEASLRSQAQEAIRNGADPAQVNARLQQMLGGGAGQPQAQSTFPRPGF
jgi:hypothetical protein